VGWSAEVEELEVLGKGKTGKLGKIQ